MAISASIAVVRRKLRNPASARGSATVYSVREDHLGRPADPRSSRLEAGRLQAGRVALSFPACGEGDWVGALAQAPTQSSWRTRSPAICLTRKSLLPARRIRRRPTCAASWREVAGHCRALVAWLQCQSWVAALSAANARKVQNGPTPPVDNAASISQHGWPYIQRGGRREAGNVGGRACAPLRPHPHKSATGRDVGLAATMLPV
jgi:hypothetical protein